MSGEFAFIESLRALATHPAARNLDDDAAVLEIGGETLIITHDSMAEGVHFLPAQDMADVAWKLVATNLSDLAAKGAKPIGVMLGYSLGSDDDRFLLGLRDALAEYDCTLLGGDTITVDGARSIGLTAIGIATHTPVPARSGAQIGDAVYVTGPVGAAMLGFEAMTHKLGGDMAAFRRPVPLLEEGRLLAPIVSAIMDISDGILLDASRIAAASKVTLDLDARHIPISTPEDRRADALRWGDDYQLLFTANRAVELPLLAYRIGEVKEPTAHLLLLNGKPPESGDSLGFRH